MSANETDNATTASSLSKNQLKNELKKKAKLDKYLAKQAKLETTHPPIKKDTKPKQNILSAAVLDEFPLNLTYHGMKKDMSKAMMQSYSPKHVESSWDAWWDEQGYFRPRFQDDGSPLPRGTFVIPIPPPNVTGSLHLGHALTVAIQDTLIRWNRMLGKTVLYNPGCDHAGIATQSIVEKRLYKDHQMTRHVLGREKFLSKVWEWKETYGGRIYTQLRRLGTSGDWSRACFTMDKKLSTAVTEAFVRLHQDGIIYRATRLVNWCSHLNTALSNLEVESKELKGRTLLSLPGYNRKVEFGVIISFAYPIKDSTEELIVATTRIETMLGDTGIAVHPEDKRYTHLVGKYACHPFIPDRVIPIVADTYVDKEFGTGAVKITPAHDPNDCELGKRHNLDVINILNDDGTLNTCAGIQFAGMKRFDARYAVLEALKGNGLYRETKDNPMELPICSRSGDVIEPRLKPQWWVNCKEMAKSAMDVVKSGELEILPKTSEKDWYRWLENIQDWCISRQLWWGHRIPAYLIRFTNPIDCPEYNEDNAKFWVSGRTFDEALTNAKHMYPGLALTIEQDPDVLDTWFSSGLWPFSIFGWPENTQDLASFYPTSLLETGWDILFFWVVRMVMLGIKLTGKVPFSRVFCHAMVRDAHGRKMSKSLGNVIDPVDVIEGITLDQLYLRLEEGNLDKQEIEKAKLGQQADYPKGIPECGTDALRFALCAYMSGGRDINLDILRVEGYRKFCNKLWNATRFALSKLPSAYQVPIGWNAVKDTHTEVEKWILYKLNNAAGEVNMHLSSMNFMATTTAMHAFWLYELCDVYLEASKVLATKSALATLYTCLDQGLRMLHPIMPFVTEELWQRLPTQPGQAASIVIAPYPEYSQQVDYQFMNAAQQFDIVLEVVRSIRSLQSDYNILVNAVVYVCVTGNLELGSLLDRSQAVIYGLVKGLAEITVTNQIPEGCVLVSVSEVLKLGLLVKGHVKVDIEVAKVEAKKAKVEIQIKSLKQKMLVDGYETKVKLEVRESNVLKLNSLQAEVDVLTASIENFMKLK